MKLFLPDLKFLFLFALLQLVYWLNIEKQRFEFSSCDQKCLDQNVSK